MALLIFRIVMWVVPWRYFTHGTLVIISFSGTMVNGNYVSSTRRRLKGWGMSKCYFHVDSML